MKDGTHNLGRDARGQLALAKINRDGLLIMVGTARVMLDADQARLLKDAMS